MRIAVAGGTGTVGTLVVMAAGGAGHQTVVIARSKGVDLVTGQNLPQALVGVDTVIDVSSVASLGTRRSVRFFERATANLLAAEADAGVRHHVALSIVGAARATSGYYAGKAVQERMLMSSDAPWSVLRATQFHEFAGQIARRGTLLGVGVVPKMISQPVAASEVAIELVGLAEDEPCGFAQDLAGPEVKRVGDMVRSYLRASGRRGHVVEVRMPGSMGRIGSDGSLLPGPAAKLGVQTFEQWLEENVGVS